MTKIIHLFFFSALFMNGYAQTPLDKYYADIEKPFSSISDNYTLILTAKIEECGEFGGHQETIELKKINSQLSAIISIYDKNCNGEWRLDEEKILSSKTYQISKEKLILFDNYLGKLITVALKDEVPYHAGSHFSANLQNRTDSNYKNQRIKLYYHDFDNKWVEFENLKKEIVK